MQRGYEFEQNETCFFFFFYFQKLLRYLKCIKRKGIEIRWTKNFAQNSKVFIVARKKALAKQQDI